MDLAAYAILIGFYGALLFWLYWLVRRNIHPSRSLVLGYLASLGAVVAFFVVTSLALQVLAVATGNTQNPDRLFVGAGVSALAGSVILAWQLCKSRLSQPRRD